MHHRLTHLIDELSHLLPAQGPISIFIHHNTLHAFEHLPFEEAVEHAAMQLGREPFLAESRYRDKLASGRIRARDVDALLREELGGGAGADVAGVGSRLQLWLAVVLHGIPASSGPELSWILEETEALSRFRIDVPADARSTFAAVRELSDRAGEEQRAVRRLWNASLAAVGRAAAVPAAAGASPVRHRDWLFGAFGLDIDHWFHPPLIRFLAGYLDQGLAHWAMPERSRGIHGCFVELYRTSLSSRCGAWARTLPQLVADDHESSRSQRHHDDRGVLPSEPPARPDRPGAADGSRRAPFDGPRGSRGGTTPLPRDPGRRHDEHGCGRSAGRHRRRGRGGSTKRRDRCRFTDRSRTCGPGCASVSRGRRRQRPSSAHGRSSTSRSCAASTRQSSSSGLREKWPASSPSCDSSTAFAAAASCIRHSSGRFAAACTMRSGNMRRSRRRNRRRSRRCSASTNGRSHFAAIWRKSSRRARRSARPVFSTSRCITRD